MVIFHSALLCVAWGPVVPHTVKPLLCGLICTTSSFPTETLHGHGHQPLQARGLTSANCSIHGWGWGIQYTEWCTWFTGDSTGDKIRVNKTRGNIAPFVAGIVHFVSVFWFWKIIQKFYATLSQKSKSATMASLQKIKVSEKYTIHLPPRMPDLVLTWEARS